MKVNLNLFVPIKVLYFNDGQLQPLKCQSNDVIIDLFMFHKSIIPINLLVPYNVLTS